MYRGLQVHEMRQPDRRQRCCKQHSRRCEVLRSPAANPKQRPSGNSASCANSVQPPERRSVSSPRPSHTPSICGATATAGTLSEAHRMSPGKRIRTAHTRVACEKQSAADAHFERSRHVRQRRAAGNPRSHRLPDHRKVANHQRHDTQCRSMPTAKRVSPGCCLRHCRADDRLLARANLRTGWGLDIMRIGKLADSSPFSNREVTRPRGKF